MAGFKHGKIVSVEHSEGDPIWCVVAIGDHEVDAVSFPGMTGQVHPGDRVVVNTTGIDLGLGTGGVAFVLWNLDLNEDITPGPGHIIKMRYTPWQTEVMAAEAPESPHHGALRDVTQIEGTAVVACGLHSQLGAVAAGIRAVNPQARIGYLMTDGAALPMGFSKQVQKLRAAGLVDVTCTAGHASGGDLESVNVFSGLAALRHAGKADRIIVSMGPGVVGTSTALGFTAMEQGQVCDAATALGGRSIAALRVSFTDRRERHVGVSHHTLTALMVAARERTTVVMPRLPDDRMEQMRSQLQAAGIFDRHEVVTEDGGPGLRLLADLGIRPTSMGRSLDEAPELFVAASAAGCYAGNGVGTSGPSPL